MHVITTPYTIPIEYLLCESKSLQLQTIFYNATGTSFLFNLTALLPQLLPYHMLSATIRAINVMGAVESTSDGVMVVPVGPSTGQVR